MKPLDVISEPARRAYRKLVSQRARKAVYRKLHLEEFRAKRYAVYPSEKGTFALRGFDRLRSIFVHTPKAAGTSVALSIFGELPYHYTAEDYIAIFGRKTFHSYFSFTFVRNPWDRVYSAYRYLHGGGWDEKDREWASQFIAPYASFREFILKGLRKRDVQNFMHFRPQVEFVCNWRSKVLVNYVGYFETISEDFEKIVERIGIEASLGVKNRSTDGEYQTAFDSECLKVVGRVYAKDIATFGYRFDGIERRLTF